MGQICSPMVRRAPLAWPPSTHHPRFLFSSNGVSMEISLTAAAGDGSDYADQVLRVIPKVYSTIFLDTQLGRK